MVIIQTDDGRGKSGPR